MWVCRLPVHIGPAGCTGFTEILGEFVTSHWADRVVGPYSEASMHTYPVGADDSVRLQDVPVFLEILGEFAAAHRAERSPAPCQLRSLPGSFPVDLGTRSRQITCARGGAF